MTVAFRLLHDGECAPARATPDDLADAARLGPTQGALRLMRRRRIRGLAAEILDVHPDRIRFEREPDGRARIIAPEPLYASVAGRGAWTALAVAPRPVGVDVETYPAVDWPPGDGQAGEGPPLDLLQLEEQDAILADPDPSRMFLRFWTAREAYLKADGRGLSVMPEKVRAANRLSEVSLIEAGRPAVTARLVERDDAIAAIVELSPTA
jgi:4'-phosphopantetheinyl transferase